MITDQAEQLKPGKRICLQPSQVLALSRSAADQWLAINISDGIIRLATNQQQDGADITLAFLSHSDSGLIHHPTNQQLFIHDSRSFATTVHSQPPLGPFIPVDAKSRDISPAPPTLVQLVSAGTSC
jgi:ABC-type uncharacterized transport system permease subunit